MAKAKKDDEVAAAVPDPELVVVPRAWLRQWYETVERGYLYLARLKGSGTANDVFADKGDLKDVADLGYEGMLAKKAKESR